MNKFICFCLFFFLVSNAYKCNSVSSKKTNGKVQGVITFNEAVQLVKSSEKKHFIFGFYHSDFCKYCNMVKSFIQKNPNILFLKEQDWMNKKNGVPTHSAAVVLLSKNIHKGSKDKTTPFFDELFQRTKKVQVPALLIGNKVLFESKDIMNFLTFVVNYVGTGKSSTPKKSLRNNGTKIKENTVNMKKEDKVPKENEKGAPQNEEVEVQENTEDFEEEEEEAEDAEDDVEECPGGSAGGCGFNMGVPFNQDLLLSLLQNKEVLAQLNNLALQFLNQQGNIGSQQPIQMPGDNQEEDFEDFEENKKDIKHEQILKNKITN